MTDNTKDDIDLIDTKATGKAGEKGLGQSKATDLVTLDQLAREMKVSSRDARMLLRLAAKQTKLYPTLGKEHVARQPWRWSSGSKALEEARKALSIPSA